MRVRLNPSHPSMVLLLRDLESGPATIHDLRAVLRLSLRATYVVVRAARRLRLVRIAGWERMQGGRPVYALGCAPDAPRPPQLTQTERQRQHRAKLRSALSSPPVGSGIGRQLSRQAPR